MINLVIFYLETHNLILYSELDYIANKFDDGRLVFGTYFPYNSPDASMMPVIKAQIDEKSKYKLAGQNLCRLFSEVRV